MTTEKKDSVSEKNDRVKIGKLRVNKETIKDLTDKETEQIKGGMTTTLKSMGCETNFQTRIVYLTTGPVNQ